MKYFNILPAAAVTFTLAACGNHGADFGSLRASPASQWRNVATPADRERLRNWRSSWVAALTEARAAGRGVEIDRHDALFDPDAALARATPPPGDYRCRVFKLGTRSGTGLAYVAYPFFDCRIDDEGEVDSFYKRSGSQRPVGLVFPDSENRAVFLGTLVLGDEVDALQYGQDSTRDIAGLIERVGDRRWRIVLPAPAFESKLDVIELVPAP